MNVKFCCGNDDSHADDSKNARWDRKKETSDGILARALAWADDAWPDSDGNYAAVVWIEDSRGEVLVKQDVEIGADGFRINS